MALHDETHRVIKYDDYITPYYIWKNVAKYIPKDKEISMPFYADGSCAKHLRSLGFSVFHKDEDFYEYDRGDIVVDNPPFSSKRKVLETLVKRNKPFMLLLPVSTLCYEYTRILPSVQILIPAKRPKFIKYNKKLKIQDKNWKKKCSSFDCVWMCYKMNFEKDVIFM